MTDQSPIPVQLVCQGCGWVVHGLMGGSNGSTPEHARADLARALHWSPDGKLCDYCRSQTQPAHRARRVVEACA